MPMTDDPRTYSRATQAALIGFGVQLFLSIVAAGLAIWTDSIAYDAASWHLFGGLIVWGALWLIYNQHRLERTEALEAEQLAGSSADAAALFNEQGHELALARKRLEGFYRWGLNVIAITVALYLLAAGAGMLAGYLNLIDRPAGEAAEYGRLLEASYRNTGASALGVMLASAALALVGFLTARYVAGMTSVKQWTLLRAGSAYLMGNVLVLALLALAGAFELGGSRVGFAILALAIPGMLLLLGVETALAFVFGAYRPRKPGEVVRPAFDSRLLGWLTRPESIGKIVAETLNYQFGFEISRSWFYQLLGRAIVPLVVLLVLALLGLSCVVITPPQQQTLVTTLGKLDPDRAVRGPGVSFKPPWPIAKAEKFDAFRVQTMRVGSIGENRKTDVAMLWTNQHSDTKETYLVTPPMVLTNDDAQASNNTVSANVVGGELVVQYRIGDLLRYVGGTGDLRDNASRPEKLLRAIAESHLSAFVATRTVDQLLSLDRASANAELRRKIADQADDLGLEVVDVGLFNVHPPQDGEVSVKFLDVVNALQSQKTTIANAQRDRVATLSRVAGSVEQAVQIAQAIDELDRLTLERNRAADDARRAALDPQVAQQQAAVQALIDQAGGESSKVLAEARAQRWTLALSEQARAASFLFDMEAYRRAPEYFKQRMYLDTIAANLRDARKIISTVRSEDPAVIRLNLEDQAGGAELFMETP